MDIAEALASTTAAPTNRRCVVGRFLDNLAEDDGHTDLVATFQTADKRGAQYRPLHDLTRLTVLLGQPISQRSVQLHRSQTCVCHGFVA